MIATLEMFSTKGPEYLIILAYLAALVPFWLLLTRPGSAAAKRALRAAMDWFRVPDDVHVSRGHAWAAPHHGRVFRVGMDDLAKTMVGRPDAIELPAPGAKLDKGGLGWSLVVGGARIPMRSPVGGEVIAVNRALERDPALLSDAYGDGWLLEVRVPARRGALAELASGEKARVWMDEATEQLRLQMGGELGLVMQDGGTPVDGFGRHLGTGWPVRCAELFGTTDLVAPAGAAPAAEGERVS
jgi:glycine cleavage system H protein